jgi:hypothetical protein
MPSDALGTLPRPLLRLIYPAQVDSRSPSPEPTAAPVPYDPTISRSTNLSAAEKLREQMRRDMLTQLGGEDEERVRFGVKPASDEQERDAKAEIKEEKGYEGIDWESMVSGTKKVLSMDVSLPTVELSDIRHRHTWPSLYLNFATSTCSASGAHTSIVLMTRWRLQGGVQEKRKMIINVMQVVYKVKP